MVSASGRQRNKIFSELIKVAKFEQKKKKHTMFTRIRQWMKLLSYLLRLRHSNRHGAATIFPNFTTRPINKVQLHNKKQLSGAELRQSCYQLVKFARSLQEDMIIVRLEIFSWGHLVTEIRVGTTSAHISKFYRVWDQWILGLQLKH